ncbi:MAG: hypothetical protein EA397_16255 [Deltaproteobacteria bacterium]|nr:MAG: hypothetical protein EA397_16255 [Deltaproteobacteria bacterium]
MPWLLLASLSLAEVPDERPAQLTALNGSGYARLDGDPVRLEEQLFLPHGTEVCTDQDSFATLRLGGEPGCEPADDLTLLPGTCLTLRSSDSRTGPSRRVINVRTGALSVRERDLGTELTIHTPSGSTSGTQGGFRVAVEEAAMRSEAVSRAVSVRGAGAQIALEAGLGVRTPTGQRPGQPIALLPPGSPVSPEPEGVLHTPDFTWTPVERALGYRVEIASDAAFTKLLRRTEVGRLRWEPTQLFLPYRLDKLYWRVTSFDRLGFDGIPSEGRALNFPRGVRADPD